MKLRLFLLALVVFMIGAGLVPGVLYAQVPVPTVAVPIRATTSPSPSPSESPEPTPEPTPKPNLTEESQETLGPLEKVLRDQELGPVWPSNPVKYAIRAAIDAGVPANTIVLLLLLPVVAALIAATRHLIGVRGFGIFLPAALSVVFISTGPVVGIMLFLIIVIASTMIRMFMRGVLAKRMGIKLQYLPRMALILWFVVLAVLGVLFASPLVSSPDFTEVSIFPVLILVLLAEDFSKVQAGKNIRTAANLTTETLILSLLSFFFLTLEPLQAFALLYPELLLILVAIFDILIGRYVGLRFIEFWRFRKLISD